MTHWRRKFVTALAGDTVEGPDLADRSGAIVQVVHGMTLPCWEPVHPLGNCRQAAAPVVHQVADMTIEKAYALMQARFGKTKDTHEIMAVLDSLTPDELMLVVSAATAVTKVSGEALALGLAVLKVKHGISRAATEWEKP